MSDFAFNSDLYSLWVLMGLPCQAIHVVGSWVFVCVFLYCCHVFFFFFPFIYFFSWSGVISLQNPVHTQGTAKPARALVGDFQSIRCCFWFCSSNNHGWSHLASPALHHRILGGFDLLANIYLIHSHGRPSVYMELWRKASRQTLQVMQFVGKWKE